MFDTSYLKSSGQFWKIYLFFVLQLVAFALVMTAVSVGHGQSAEQMALLLFTGLTLGFGSFVWTCFAVKCPKCKTRLFWKAVSGQSSQNWLIRLFALNNCPVCQQKP